MAYVPPHKRHSKESGGQSPVPASLSGQFKKGLNFRSPGTNAHQSGKIVYADNAISRWLAVGLDDDGDHLPSGVFLRPVSVEAFERKSGEKPLALAKSCTANEDDETGRDHNKKPWVHIAETVMPDLVSSYEVVRSEIEGQSMEEIKPTLVARFGKILFHGSPSFPAEACGDMVTETSLRQLKRSFYTNHPASFVENVTLRVIPEIGLSFAYEKDIYRVELSDKSRPGATISCKCIASKAEQGLELYKEEEKNSIRDLITSAVIDSSVKGGLRYPLGKESSGDRYSVIGVWHTISKTYKNSSMRLKVTHADRFNFRTSHGEVTEETVLKLKGITSALHGQSLGTDLISEMLKDAVKMVWEHFLSCGNTVI
ncbi:hypothetical protein BT93_B1714 [Corymbia citriodora subsp. variegata]|nr:hypothetical protein BT93_B1714 [Corymbia citriodora subsp. variegata]